MSHHQKHGKPADTLRLHGKSDHLLKLPSTVSPGYRCWWSRLCSDRLARAQRLCFATAQAITFELDHLNLTPEAKTEISNLI